MPSILSDCVSRLAHRREWVPHAPPGLAHPGLLPICPPGLAALWRRFTFLALSLLGLLACTAVSAQPFMFTPGAFQPELTEAAQRVQSNMTGFVFDFANATVRLGARTVRCIDYAATWRQGLLRQCVRT